MTAKKWVNETCKYLGNGKAVILPEYTQWSHMKRRCKTDGDYQTQFPSYLGCTYVPEWKSYDVWLEWARQQVGFLCRDEKGKLYENDKDILFKGNKIYSPDTCVFVSQELNKFLTDSLSARGGYPIGVCLRGDIGKFVAQLSIGSKRYLGCFDTPTEAFQAYKVAKESKAKELAIKYTGLVDPRVIDALNNFTVNIDD